MIITSPPSLGYVRPRIWSLESYWWFDNKPQPVSLLTMNGLRARNKRGSSYYWTLIFSHFGSFYSSCSDLAGCCCSLASTSSSAFVSRGCFLIHALVPVLLFLYPLGGSHSCCIYLCKTSVLMPSLGGRLGTLFCHLCHTSNFAIIVL